MFRSPRREARARWGCVTEEASNSWMKPLSRQFGGGALSQPDRVTRRSPHGLSCHLDLIWIDEENHVNHSYGLLGFSLLHCESADDKRA